MKKKNFLPGFGLSLGYSVFYLSLILLLPLSALIFKSFSIPWEEFWNTVTSKRVMISYQLSFSSAFIAAVINTIIGFIISWTLVRYDFFGKRLFDAIIDLPFALPTAVAGISLMTIFSSTGIIGKYLEPMGIKLVYTQAGIIMAMCFVSLPFVVRTIQPILSDFPKETEEAALLLNATRLQIFFRVILPELRGAVFASFTLAFARSLGEFGSIVFISGNLPMKTEIAPLLIMAKLEQFDYNGAAAIAIIMLGISFILLLLINLFQVKLNKKTK